MMMMMMMTARDNCGSSICSEHSELITGCQACADAAKMGIAETPVDEDTATAVTTGIEAKKQAHD